MAEQKKTDDEALAKAYREGTQDDAVHGLSGGTGDYDPTLVTTPEIPNVPMRDGTKFDPVDSEDHNAPPSEKGPYYDALMRGLEPGETSME